MASKLVKGNMNIKRTLESASTGDLIYLEPLDIKRVNDVMKTVSSYASRLRIKVKQTAFKGLSQDDEVFKIIKVEIV